MKKSALLLFMTLACIACKENPKKAQNDALPAVAMEETEALYGADFNNETTLSPDQVGDIYKNLKQGDTVNVTFKAPVKAVCKDKGCWMEFEVGGQDPVMVRFKDYAFFVPKDIENKEVTVNGRAFLSMMSVDELRHLAEDAGENETYINAIDAPERRMSFTAEGVKIPE